MMNAIIKSVAIVGILLLGACASKNSGSVDDAGFYSSIFTLPETFLDRFVEARNSPNDRTLVDDEIAYDYLDSISFDTKGVTIFEVNEILGEDPKDPKNPNSIIIIYLNKEIDRLHLTPPMSPTFGNHIFVGMHDTIDVGEPLSATATFRGHYGLALSVAPSDRRNILYDGIWHGSRPITLTADFDSRSLTGESDGLTVNGQFSGESNILSGSVSYYRARINDRTFTAPLTGFIGVDGAVGVFSSHENTGEGLGHAFAGGFVVD